MGCSSSTEVVTDPSTGKSKQKKKLGGSYPGNRRPQNAPYMPPQSEFTKIDGNHAEATAHFVAYGGGNALVLQNQPNQGPSTAAAPVDGGKQYISVTLPEGVSPGDTIHVQAPDGQLNAIVVPPGMGPGSTFTVEFASGPPPPATTAPPIYTPPMTQASSPPAPVDNTHDDGFATGFNNPYGPSAPPPAAAPMATASYADQEINLGTNGSSYPSATAAPYEPYVTNTSSYPSTTAAPYVPNYGR